MPVVNVDADELRRLAGADDVDEETLLEDLFALGLEYEGRTEDDELQLEFGPDRLDRLSVEGVARSLRYQYGVDRGIDVPRTNESNWTIEVDESVPDDRPYIAGAVIRNLDLTEDILMSLIQLQEKLHQTMGRGREKGAIGLHDLTMLKGAAGPSDDESTVTYRGIDPEADRFVPLEAEAEMTPGEVLTDHPTGREYAGIVAPYESLPAIYDEIGLFSFPPIINGLRTEVTPNTRDILIELTGTEQWTIDKMLSIICYAFDARGATIERVDVSYPDVTVERPDFEVRTKRVDHDLVERVLGIDLAGDTVIDLMERSGLEAQPAETDAGLAYDVDIPPYRVDVLHPIDIVDDIGRAYGFNDLEPRYPDVNTVGGRHEPSRFERAVRNVMVGLGFEDLLNFNLVSTEANFDRMGIRPTDEAYGAARPPRIAQPYSEEYEIVRTWALPSLLQVLENNTHRSYPQELSEIGLATRIDGNEPTSVAERRSVAAVIARSDASYEVAKSRLTGLCRRFEVPLETPRVEHPTFIGGRAATIDFGTGSTGVIGEFHPSVLTEFDLEVPVAAFEFDLAALHEAVNESGATDE